MQTISPQEARYRTAAPDSDWCASIPNFLTSNPYIQQLSYQKKNNNNKKKTTPVSFTIIVKDPPQPLSVDKCIPIKNAYINSFKQETKITSKEISTLEICKQWNHYTFKKGFWNFDQHRAYFQSRLNASQHSAFKTHSQNCDWLSHLYASSSSWRITLEVGEEARTEEKTH